MEVTLLGTGDTAGTPVPACDCETCDRARELGVERTRFSVHVRGETGQSLLVDFSPDFRRQFLRDDVPLPDAGIVTHVHYDHVAGIGNLHRLLDDLPVHAADEPAPATGTADTATDEPAPATGESVAETARERFDYLDALDVRPEAPHEPFDAAGFSVTLVPVDHPPLPTYGLRIEEPGTGAALAITGDTTYAIPEASRAVLADADLLLADAIVPASFCADHRAGGDHRDAAGVPRTFGTKHLTREGALALAAELGADDVRLVHCSHFYDPGEAFEAPLAVDGERIEL